jgi:hypothetical protein
MNVKENYYIYKHKRRKELMEEQQKNKKENNQSSLFEIVLETDKDKYKNDKAINRKLSLGRKQSHVSKLQGSNTPTQQKGRT